MTPSSPSKSTDNQCTYVVDRFRRFDNGSGRMRNGVVLIVDGTPTGSTDVIEGCRIEALDEKETKVFGELRTLLSVGEGMLRGTTNAVFTVHGKGADVFRIGLPDEVTVLDVNAQGVRDWSVGAQDGTGDEGAEQRENVLTVRLNYLAQGTYSFQVSFELPLRGVGLLKRFIRKREAKAIEGGVDLIDARQAVFHHADRRQITGGDTPCQLGGWCVGKLKVRHGARVRDR